MSLAQNSRRLGIGWPGRLGMVWIGLVFLMGLLIGWLLIGWWLWPAQPINADPWLLRSEHQHRYIRLVAMEYARTGESARVRQALEGWDQDELTRLLSEMRNQASDLEERRQLNDLAEALALTLPQSEPALLTTLLNQKLLLLSILLAVSPLVAALVLVISPAVWPGIQTSDQTSLGALGQGARELERDLDEMLAPDVPPQETATDPVALDALNVGADEQTAEDILADIFGKRQEQMAYYEALCRDLEEIAVGDLVQKAHRVIEQIERSNELRR